MNARELTLKEGCVGGGGGDTFRGISGISLCDKTTRVFWKISTISLQYLLTIYAVVYLRVVSLSNKYDYSSLLLKKAAMKNPLVVSRSDNHPKTLSALSSRLVLQYNTEAK